MGRTQIQIGQCASEREEAGHIHHKILGGPRICKENLNQKRSAEGTLELRSLIIQWVALIAARGLDFCELWWATILFDLGSPDMLVAGPVLFDQSLCNL